jgi:putative transposase
VTHRCHQREFLLKFKQDRNTYREMMRERLATYRVSLFTYSVTSNHVHLLLRPNPDSALESLSGFMQSLEGDFAQHYNLRKGRRNAFWGDRYHATMVESGSHVWRCLIYIDLNMVRAGRVEHPEDWAWSGYRELMGLRERYRVLDTDQLLDHLGGVTLSGFRSTYKDSIQEALKRRQLAREAQWTESLAVGSEAYVRAVGSQIAHRIRLDYREDGTDPSSWQVREARPAYALNANSDPDNIF